MIFDFDDQETSETILTELRKNKQLEISNSSPFNIEVNALGINKANALKKVCDRIGISMDLRSYRNFDGSSARCWR